MNASSGRLKRRDRVAMATWPGGVDARIGMHLQLDWDRIARTHPNIAPVAIVGFALGQALAANPVANRRAGRWKVRPHRTVRLSFAIHASNDLRIAVVDRADELSPQEFQRGGLPPAAAVWRTRRARHWIGCGLSLRRGQTNRARSRGSGVRLISPWLDQAHASLLRNPREKGPFRAISWFLQNVTDEGPC